MLLHINRRTDFVHPLEGAAHIVISLDAKGGVTLVRAFIGGQMDQTQAGREDPRLLGTCVPGILAELRGQLSKRSGST